MIPRALAPRSSAPCSGSHAPRPRPGPTLALSVLVLLGGCGGTTGTDPAVDDALHRVRAAEDSRRPGEPVPPELLAALESPHAEVRAAAVRGLGRFERAELLPRIATLLGDPEPRVRAEAANAVGQAVRQGPAGNALDTLEARLALEEDPLVRGVYGQTLGGLAYDDAGGHARAEALLVTLQAESVRGPRAGPARTLALARGFEALARRGATIRPLGAEAVEVMAELALDRSGARTAPLAAARTRRAALAGYLVGPREPDPTVLAAALNDDDHQVRRIATRGLAGEAGTAPLGAGLADPSPMVRLEAVRVAGGGGPGGCEALLAAVDDPDPHVALAALDALAAPCPDPSAQVQALARVAADSLGPSEAWHRRAHAVASLAELAPERAGDAVAALSRHRVPFARAWAARAAAPAGSVDVLDALAGDPDPNVREAAIRGLARLRGRAADPVLIAQLEADDPQLGMTAAALLEGTSDPEALPGLVEALTRFSAPRRETYRDVRVAVLERIAQLGDASRAPDLEPYLRDFDPRVAELASRVMEDWTGAPHPAEPSPLPRTPVPDPDRMALLSRSAVALDMADGGRVVIRLLPELAPTNADRFARLAEEGYFDGLTFHRVAANFVIQGGSPHANEYSGDGAYSRDEVTLMGHWRGTVGLSTRGRDTGDAQIFVNLVDNLRLDHDYTIFGVVEEGMEVVDRALEGAVITRATVLEGVR